MNGLTFAAEKLKKLKDNRVNCPMYQSVMFRCRVGVLALALVIGIATFLVNLRIQGPTIQPDEGSYLAIAAAIAGFPNDMANSYHAGYSVLIAPAFLIADTPQGIWTVVKAINAVLIFISVGGLWWLSGLLQPGLNYWRRLGAVGLTSLYPMWVVMAGYSFAQIAFVPIFTLFFCVYIRSLQGGVGTWVTLGLLGGFLYWIHPIGAAVILALLITNSYVAYCRRWWGQLAVMTGTLAGMVLLYQYGVTPWLFDRMTTSGLQPKLHYPSIAMLISPLLTLDGLKDVLARTGGSFFYLTVGTVGLIWVGLIRLTSRALRSVQSEREPCLLAERAVAAFLWLAVLGSVGLGVLLFSSTPEAQRLDHWMYGRYVEGVIAPILLAGLLASSYRKALLAVPIAVACAWLLSMALGDYTHIAYFNIPALWQAFVLSGQGLWVWVAAGSVPIIGLAMAPRKVGMLMVAGVFIYSSYLQITWHEAQANSALSRWEAALSVRDMYPPGTRVGFEHSDTDSLNKVFWFDFGFVLFDYGLQRITAEDWFESFNGPLFTFDRHLDERGIEAYPIAVSPHDGPTLWVKGSLPAGEMVYPINVADRSIALLSILGRGWHEVGQTHVWSGKVAELRLPIPAENRGGGYFAKLTLVAYGGRADREVTAFLETNVNGVPVSDQFAFRSGIPRQVLVPLSADQANQVIRISVPAAISPKELEGSQDLRVLGVALQRIELGRVVYPIEVASPSFALLGVLGEGWHDLERAHVWSGTEAVLRLPVAEENLGGGYLAEITLVAYGVRTDREVTVNLETNINGVPESYQHAFRSEAPRQFLVPLSADQANQVIRISVPDAVSPKELEDSQDLRVLGVALQIIDLVRGDPDIRIGTVLRADKFAEITPTKVGNLQDGALVTTGRAGFLVFGPYAAMSAGEYRLVVRGAADSAESAWVEVVSGKGSVKHARFSLSSPPGGEPGILSAGRVSLAEPVDDLEVRVSVGEDDVVRLEGYELVPIK